MEWTIFLTFGGIFSFFVGVVTPVIKLNTSIVKLTLTMDNVDAKLRSLDSDNAKGHDRIWQELENHETRILENEKKIVKIESKGEY